MNNYGFSFGFWFPFFQIVAGLIWIGLVIFNLKQKSVWLWLVVLGGGLNIGERIVNGYVNDYWKIPMLPIYNNINDWLIFVGIGGYWWKNRK